MEPVLFIMRHGKSDWSTGSEDYDRPLNERGRRDVAKLGAWLAVQTQRPRWILTSTARRAAQTTHILAQTLSIEEPDIEWDERLYLASLETLRAALQRRSRTDCLLVGHNPGLESLAKFCCRTVTADVPFRKLLPTAGLIALRPRLQTPLLERNAFNLIFHQRPKLLRKESRRT